MLCCQPHSWLHCDMPRNMWAYVIKHQLPWRDRKIAKKKRDSSVTLRFSRSIESNNQAEASSGCLLLALVVQVPGSQVEAHRPAVVRVAGPGLVLRLRRRRGHGAAALPAPAVDDPLVRCLAPPLQHDVEAEEVPPGHLSDSPPRLLPYNPGAEGWGACLL